MTTERDTKYRSLDEALQVYLKAMGRTIDLEKGMPGGPWGLLTAVRWQEVCYHSSYELRHSALPHHEWRDQ